MDKTLQQQVGENVRRLRREQGLTQQQLGYLTQTNSTYIVRLEHGRWNALRRRWALKYGSCVFLLRKNNSRVGGRPSAETAHGFFVPILPSLCFPQIKSALPIGFHGEGGFYLSGIYRAARLREYSEEAGAIRSVFIPM